MKITVDVPEIDYWPICNELERMAASEELYDDKVKSEKAITLGVALEVIKAVESQMAYSNICPFYGNDCEAKDCCECSSRYV